MFLCANVDGDGSERCWFDEEPAMFKLFKELASYGDVSVWSCGSTRLTAAFYLNQSNDRQSQIAHIQNNKMRLTAHIYVGCYFTYQQIPITFF